MKKAFVIIGIIIAIGVISFAFIRNVPHNVIAVKAKTMHPVSVNKEMEKIVPSGFKFKKIDFPLVMPFDTINAYFDKASDTVWKLTWDPNSNFYTLYYFGVDNLKNGIITLKSTNDNPVKAGKVFSDAANIYAGVENTLFEINKKLRTVKEIKLPPVKFAISKNLVPQTDCAEHYIIDMCKIGNDIAITRNCTSAILLYDIRSGKFSYLKLPASFGSVNRLLADNSRNFLFVTNFYSGDGSRMVENRFGYIDMRTKEFYIFDAPVKYLLECCGTIYGITPRGGFFKTGNNFEKIEFVSSKSLYIIASYIASNKGLWFVGSDLPIDDSSGASGGFRGGFSKPVEYVGLYLPNREVIEKQYLPLIEVYPTYPYGVKNKAPLKGISSFAELFVKNDGTVILVRGGCDTVEITP